MFHVKQGVMNSDEREYFHFFSNKIKKYFFYT